jgi:MoaA/NifB/PqqE/SkfB family radical SAM enzyme
VSINIKIWLLKLFRLDKYVMPYKALVNLTDLCNSRCIFCNIWKTDKKTGIHTIGVRDLSMFFEDMGNNLVWLALSGGEVTLVSHLKEMLKEAKRKCQKLKIVSFTTNGLNPAKALEFAKFLKDNKFDVIVTVSLDGDEKLHDQLRGVKGNYKKCMLLYDTCR